MGDQTVPVNRTSQKGHPALAFFDRSSFLLIEVRYWSLLIQLIQPKATTRLFSSLPRRVDLGKDELDRDFLQNSVWKFPKKVMTPRGGFLHLEDS